MTEQQEFGGQILAHLWLSHARLYQQVVLHAHDMMWPVIAQLALSRDAIWVGEPMGGTVPALEPVKLPV